MRTKSAGISIALLASIVVAARQAPPAYQLTDQDRRTIGVKLSELDPLARSLKETRGEDDLVADVEIHAKAGTGFSNSRRTSPSRTM